MNWRPQVAWAFPAGTVVAPGQYRIFFLDAQPGLSVGEVLHASFRVNATNGSLALVQVIGDAARVVNGARIGLHSGV